MLSNVAFWAMKKFMAPYFQNLDDAALKISVLEGKVTLTNLHLKKEVLQKELGLPISITAGVVGLLHLEVSWKNLFSKPIRVTLDEVTLIVEPTEEQKYDAEKEKQAKLKQRRDQLDALDKDEAPSADDDLFSSKIVFGVVNNLQVTVKRIHLRYEDSGAVTPCSPFAGGVTLGEITICSADSNWRPTVKELSHTVARKLLELKNLSIYLDGNTDTHALISTSKQSIADIRAVMNKVFQDQSNLDKHHHILRPLAFNGQLCINKKVVTPDGKRPPQFELDFAMPSIGLDLRRVQFLNILSSASHFSLAEKRKEHKRLRPAVPVSGHALAWWTFAAKSITRRWRRRRDMWSWAKMKQRRDLRLEYVELFTRVLKRQASSADAKRAKAIEEDERLSINDIRLYRKIAKSRVPKRSLGGGLMKSVKSWFWSSSSSSAQTSEDIERELSESRKELVQMLAKEEDYETPKDADYVGAIVNAALKSLVLRLLRDSADAKSLDTSKGDCLLQFECDDLTANALQRPVGDGLCVKASLSRTFAQVHCPVTNRMVDLLKALMGDAGGDDDDGQLATSLQFDVNPIPMANEPHIDMALKLVMQGHMIQLQPRPIKSIVEFFQVPPTINTADIVDATSASLVHAQQQMRAGLEHAINTRKNMKLDVNIRAPVVSVSVPTDVEHAPKLLVADLGTVAVHSSLQEPTDTTTLSLKDLQVLMYDRYNIDLQQIKVLLVDNMDQWRELQTKKTSTRHIVDETKIHAVVGKCLRENDVQLPFITVNARIDDIRVGVSDQQVLSLLSLASTFIGDLDLQALTEQAAVWTEASTFDADAYRYTQSVEDDFERFLASTDSNNNNGGSATQASKKKKKDSGKGEAAQSSAASTPVSRKPTLKRTPSGISSKSDNHDDDEDEFQDASSELRPAATPKPPPSDIAIRLLQADLKIARMEVQLYEALADGRRKKNLCFTAYDLSAYVNQRTLDMVVEATLAGIDVGVFSGPDPRRMEEMCLLYTRDDAITTPDVLSSSEARRMASCQSTNKNFVSLSATIVDPKHPDLQTSFSNTLVTVQGDISRLAISLEQHAAVALVKTTLPLVQGVVTKIADMTAPAAQAELAWDDGKGSTTQLSAAQATGAAAAAGSDTTASPTTITQQQPQAGGDDDDDDDRVRPTDMAIAFHSTGLDIGIATGRTYLAVLSVDNLSANVVQCGTQTTIQAQLGQPRLRNHSVVNDEGYLYRDVIDVIASDTLIDTQLLLEADPKQGQVPLSISLRAAPLRIFVLPDFIAGVLEFIAPVLTTLEDISANADDAADRSGSSTTATSSAAGDVEDDTEADGRMHVDILVSSPTVVVPLSPYDTTAVVIDLGSITVTNNVTACVQNAKFSKDPELLGRDVKSALLYNHMLVKISGLNLARAVVDARNKTKAFAAQVRPLAVLDDTTVEVMLQAGEREMYEEAQALATFTDNDIISETVLVKEVEPFTFELNQEAAAVMASAAVGATQVSVGQTDYLTLITLAENIMASPLMQPSSTAAAAGDGGGDDDGGELTGGSGDGNGGDDVGAGTAADSVTVPEVDVERLDAPHAAAMFMAVHLQEISASLYLDDGVSVDNCRDKKYQLTHLAVQDLRARVTMNATGTNELAASVTIAALSARDTLPRKGRADDDGYTFLTTPPGMSRALLEGSLFFRRQTIRVVGDETLDVDRLRAPLQETGKIRSLFVQQNAPEGVRVVIGWMHNYREAAAAIKRVRSLKLPGVKKVDLGPSLDSDAQGVFRGFVLYVSPELCQSLLRFFIISSSSTSTSTTSGRGPASASQQLRDQQQQQQQLELEPSSAAVTTSSTATSSPAAAAAPVASADPTRNPAYVKDVLQEGAEPRPLPQPVECFRVDATIEHPTVVVLESIARRARQFNLDFVLQAHAMFTEEVVFVDAQVSDFLIVSREGNDQSTRLDCVAPCCVSSVFRQQGGKTAISLDVDPININLAYADVRSATRFATSLVEEYERLTSTTNSGKWTQLPFRLSPQCHVPPKEAASLDVSVATAGRVTEEVLTANVPCVNLLLINTKGGLRAPLLCVSTSLSGTVTNWSRAIVADAHVQIAIAAVDPHHSSWEPILLRETRDDEVIGGYTLSLKVERGDSGKIDLSDVSIEKQSASRSTKRSHGPTGGDARNLLTPTVDTFWRCAPRKKHVVVFDMGRCIKLERFLYQPVRQPHLQPKDSRLFASDSRNGPWVEACRLSAAQQTHTVAPVQTPKFNASGRYWRWEILSRYGKEGAGVSYVGFQGAEGGLNINLQTEDRLDLTVTSTGVQHVTDILTKWMRITSVTGKSTKGAHGGRVGTHKLINLTDRTLAFTPSGRFSADVARKHVVPPGELMVFTPEREVLSDMHGQSRGTGASTGSARQQFMGYMAKGQQQHTSAITDIVIIDANKGERPPPGYRMIEKNLNEGGSGHKLYLCYGSNQDQQPITDVQVSFIGTKGCITPKIGVHEPIPAGYDMIPTNLNTGASGARDVFMSVFRGNGAPIIDMTVIYHNGTKHESIPSGFYVIRKNLSAGQKKKENPMLCIKRAPCRWTAVEPKTVTGEKPITNLFVSIIRKGARLAPQGPPDDDASNPVYWDAMYDGKPFNLNEKSGGDNIFLLRTTDTRFEPITALKIGYTREPEDEGWETTGVNLNLGNKGAALYLHFRREPGAPPVVEIRFFYTNNAPNGFIVLFPDLNKNLSMTRACYMCYRVADVNPAAIEILTPQTPRGSSQHINTAPAASTPDAGARGGTVSSSRARDRNADDDDGGGDDDDDDDDDAGEEDSSNGRGQGADDDNEDEQSSSRDGGPTHKRISKAGKQKARELYALELLRLSGDGEHAIGLEVDGFQPLQGLAISEVGETTCELTTSSGSGRCVRLVVHVRVQDGVREVIMRSPLHLENGLKHPVDVCVPGFSHTEELSISLVPEQQYSPPLGLLDTVSTDDMLVPLLRFFDPAANKHMYTTDPLQAISCNLHAQQVCTLGFVYRHQLENTVPLWLTRLSPTEHEYDGFVNQPGLVLPGQKPLKEEMSTTELQTKGLRLAGYVYPPQTSPAATTATERVELRPLHRLYNPKFKDILLTNSTEEAAAALKSKKVAYKVPGVKEADDKLAAPMCLLVKDPGQVRVRLKEGHPWSEMVEDCRLSRDPAKRDLVCKDEQRPFVCSLCPTGREMQSSFRIVEPLSFKNSLPVCVVFGLCANEEALPYSYVAVPPGGKCGFTSLVHKRALTVRMAIVNSMDNLPTHETLVRDTPPKFTEGYWSKPCMIDLDRPKKKPYTTTWVPPEELSQALTMLKLFLTLRREPAEYGPETAILYCPFQIVNNTDLQLSVRPRTTSGEPYIPRRPQPKSDYDKRKLSSGEGDTHTVWLYSPLTRLDETVVSFDGFRSRPFDVTKLVAGNTLIKCLYVDDKGEVQERGRAPKILMIHWEFADEDLLSRRLFVDPILTFKNDTSEPVHLTRVKQATDDPVDQRTRTIPPGLTWHDADVPNKTLWKLALSSVTGWSGAFAPTELGVDVRVVHTLKIHNDEDELTAVEADCFKKAGRFVVTFRPVSSTPPMRIENHTNRKIAFKQSEVTWAPEYLLNPSFGMNYALEDPNPAAKRELQLKVYTTSNTEECDWVSVPFAPEGVMKLRNKKKKGTKESPDDDVLAVVNVIPDKTTGVLHYVIANDVKHLRSLYGLSADAESEELLLNVNVLLEGGLSVSLIDSTKQRPSEFALFTLDNISASFTQTTQRLKLAAAVQKLQLDFQQHDALYPVVMYSRTQLEQKEEENRMHVFELSFVQKLGDVSGRAADSIEYFGAKLLPLELKVDGEFLAQLLRFLSVLELLPEGELTDDPPPASPVPLFCKHIFISPVDVRVTLTNADAATQDLPAVFQTIGITIPAVNSAPFNLNSFELKDTLISLTALLIRLGESYEHNVFRWLVSIGLVSTILSLDMLGDPLQVVRDVAGGFKSLFFNPVSSVLAGPEEFGAAVTKGVKDLGTGVVGGGVGMGAKMVGATGRGLAKVTFDKKFQEERERTLRAQPTGARRGFLSGARMFARGLRSGVSGVVTTPVREGKEGGVGKGLLGFGKGMLGLFVKPASGAVDLVSCTLRGIETSISGQQGVERARLPRHIHAKGTVVPYSPLKSQGVGFIQRTPVLRDNYGDIPYVAHVSEILKQDTKRGEHHLCVILALSTRILVLDVVAGKKITVQKEFDATKLRGFQEKPERNGMELTFSDSSAGILPVRDDDTYPVLGAILKTLYNLNVRHAFQVDSLDTVFRPESDHTELVQVHEYERNCDGTWAKRFIPSDPISAYVVSGTYEQFVSLKEIKPHPGWEWIGNWMLADSARDGDEAWEYARNLSSRFEKDMRNASIRRRKWVREQQEVAHLHDASTA
ncbi:hypothetical protein PTSG_12578 [Salpingoeca rosetta]|uniref:MABP domain-containing protein n=1 Tax=Salpingoeca rosetta (strain ATCC 50818 / BSB-021) TaxID=946362 RepID=F2UIK6_SALR5|nr:uncharacterized protein PTSG_12578 [Salpingoeca rosetta]EGD77055.1 hypothetical protein PTSG_12578 [Salpingoeca rosetta]|eukprot:XP_004990895.1 hypothetical protein PTSG_12578 [Salpingoeca rosetta]